MAKYIIREREREKEGCAQESIDETKNGIYKWILFKYRRHCCKKLNTK